VSSGLPLDAERFGEFGAKRCLEDLAGGSGVTEEFGVSE
jgi:hypothetical protein